MSPSQPQHLTLIPRFTTWAFIGLLCLACTSSKTRPEVSPSPTEVATFTKFVIPPTRPDEAQLETALSKAEAEPANPSAQFEVGYMYQTLSPPDRWNYLDKAIEHLERAQQLQPQRPETLMYLGLSKAAKARDPEVFLMNKLSLARKGFGFMDQAVSLDPENLSLRLLRAKASLIAPGILGRADALAEDTQWIETMAGQEDIVPLHLLAMSYIYLGDHAHRQLEDGVLARNYYQRAVKAGRGTPWGQKADSRLKGRPSDF